MELKTYKTERYTAADEEPDCGRCDHVCDDFDCSGKCGAENWWMKQTKKDTQSFIFHMMTWLESQEFGVDVIQLKKKMLVWPKLILKNLDGFQKN